MMRMMAWERAGSWRGLWVAAALLMLATLSACSGGKEDGCSVDSDCGRGQICQNSTCNEVPCFGAAECPGTNQTCLETGVCSVVECFTGDDCVVDGLGSSCINGACFSTCASNDDCASDEICNRSTQQCIPAPAECTSNDQCPTGLVCDAALSRCVEGDANNGANNDTNNGANNDTNNDTNNGANNGGVTDLAACAPCTDSAQCGGEGDECTLMDDGSKYCTTGCASDTDCPTGFECTRNLQSAPLQCIPAGNACGGCLDPDGPGCGQGQICDTDALVCVSPLSNCQGCTNDAQCGEGGRCYEVTAGQRVCGVSCTNDTDCGAGYSCANREGANVCIAVDGCDGGGNNSGTCDNPPACGDELPVLNQDFCVCVQCNADTDCGDGKVCGSNFRCLNATQSCEVVGDCMDEASPFCVGGYCVSCISNVDCQGNPAGESCFDGACGTCECPVGQTCNSRGDCVENAGCSNDADCGQGSSGPGRCDQDGQCYEPGSCNSPVFADACPQGLSCENRVFVNVCTGCSTDGDCRPGETCCTTDDGTGVCTGIPGVCF